VTGADSLHPALLHHVVNTLGWPALRPLQEQAVDPLLAGDDVLLLAPTAGGKTEAAVFPLLSAMAHQSWRGLSVLYVCPLRALLNNLAPRVDTYAQWLGRRSALWHGDTGQGQRGRIRVDPPDILLTTPESLEAMLVSTKVTPAELFGNLRAVVVDEVHAFAGDDRGWHLLAVLERLSRIAGRPLQRVGLSATVGNPEALLTWLQGAPPESRPATVVSPPVDLGAVAGPPLGEVTLDHVGSLGNAAKVIVALHAGEKRLVFCESRRAVEELAHDLRVHGVQTFVSHSSLSVDERRRAELAFAEARDCVIVSTSTLELGIDVGDLDRVIQVDAPRTVASFLQRIGRTGRRTGSRRNALFLTTSDHALLHAAGLLQLWSTGYVEPVTAPPAPRHIAAQQVLALCLQEGRVGDAQWAQWWGDLAVFDDSASAIVEHLLATGHLERDGGMLFIGPEAERRFGRRNFMDLLSVFTASPEFTVVLGREELGSVDPIVLTRKVDGPRIIVLAGRSWKVTHVDWKRRRCFVEPDASPAKMRWVSEGLPMSFELCRAQREVLLGRDPAVTLSRRAVIGLDELREQRSLLASAEGTVIVQEGDDHWWWTWAGARANATLIAAFPGAVDLKQQVGNFRLRLLPFAKDKPAQWQGLSSSGAFSESLLPSVSDNALRGLKFGDVLPRGLAVETLALRMADPVATAAVASEPRLIIHR
jgi:ATP-dependent helicase Lhr and Lhr-like helicase